MRYLLISLVLACATVASADHLRSWPVTLERVVDGDTFDFVVDLGFGHLHRDRARLREVDTWETNPLVERERGYKARDFVVRWIERCRPLRLSLPAKGRDTGKYGRWLADLHGEGPECLSLVGALRGTEHVKPPK